MHFSGRKGVVEPLTAGVALLLAISVGVTVFVWGGPFLRKSEAVSVLESSEAFMNSLAGKVKEVVNGKTGDRMSVTILPSPSAAIKTEMSFSSGIFSFEVAGTAGTIYSTGGLVPLGKNSCTPDEGVKNQNEAQTLCVKSESIGDGFATAYTLKFIRLVEEGVILSNKIDLTGASSLSATGSVILENKGTKIEITGGKEVKKFMVAVDIA